MWAFFIRNKRFSYLLMVALLGFGIFSALVIPKESAPEVQIPVGIITTVLPGAPATDIESLVTNEIERGLSGKLENLRRITSSSREGVSVVAVEFSANADVKDSVRALKDEVDTLIPRLPSEAERPMVSEVNFVDQPIMTVAIAGDLSPSEFSFLTDDIVKDLELIPGVSRVEKSGVRDPEVTILLDDTALLRYGLSVTEVVNSIRAANSLFPVGQIVTDNVAYNIILEGGVAAVSEVANVPVTALGGQPILVQDLGVVNEGLSPRVTFSRLSVAGDLPEESIILSVFKRRGGDITSITADVNAHLATLQSSGSALAGLTVYTIQDSGADIKKDLTQLTRSGLLTVTLVILLLILAIGWREALIAGLAIPLSFTIGFIGLYLSGNTINFISLFALILGIGVLVDSGIVIVEGINRRMKDHPAINKIEAALETVVEFSSPLISGTLTTVSMFVGLFVVSGVTGQFIASIPFTLIFVLFAALLVALGFLPLIAATVLHRRNSNRFEELQVEYSHRLEAWYRSKLRWILDSTLRRRVFLATICVGFISALALIPLGLVKVIFFAQSDVPMLFIEVELPEGSTKDATDLALQSVEAVLFEYYTEVKAFSTTVGSGSLFGGGGVNPKLGSIFVSLRDDRTMRSTEFSDLLRSRFTAKSDFKVTINQPDAGPPTGAPVSIKLFGNDLDTLRSTANLVADELRRIPGTTNVTTSADDTATDIVFTIDRIKASALGLNPLIISQTLRTAVFGSKATSITSLRDDIDVVVRLNLANDEFVDPEYANHTSVDRLLALELATPSGQRVPLSAVVTTDLRPANNIIRHEAGERVMTASAGITSTGNVRDINTTIVTILERGNILPEGVRYTLGGEAEESDQAFGELFLALIVGVVLMIGVLVLQFDSYRHTAYVLSILPFSLIGILYGLMLTGSALSFPSILGFIALSGIVVNNSILLIDMMNNMRRKDPSKPILDVVIDSSANRLRPILLTSATTIAGMTPLLFTDEIWIPLATAIIFGLAFSVVITLILVPIIYSRWPGRINN